MRSVTSFSQSTMVHPAVALESAVQQAHHTIHAVLQQINRIVLDKDEVVKLTLTAVLAGGHVLFEDLPGMGKTTLALSMAKTLGLHFSRVQMTNDVMPADIIGSNLFNPQTGTFSLAKGAIFSQLLLADELNRASAKTQSALLEAMEEGQVSIEGTTYALPKPFMVIATQNTQDQAGTNALPESQLDRFMMRLSLGFPSAQAELRLIQGENTRTVLQQITAVIDADTLIAWQQVVRQVYVSEAVAYYVQRLAQATRANKQRHGLSTRGVLALVHAARAYAFVAGRHFVLPEDVQQVFVPVVVHRLAPKASAYASHAAASIEEAQQWLTQIPAII